MRFIQSRKSQKKLDKGAIYQSVDISMIKWRQKGEVVRGPFRWEGCSSSGSVYVPTILSP